MNFLIASDVARLIGMEDAGAFLRARNRLERDHEFPRPMPTCLRPLKWRADAVAAWLECQGKATPPMVRGPNVLMLDEARRA